MHEPVILAIMLHYYSSKGLTEDICLVDSLLDCLNYLVDENMLGYTTTDLGSDIHPRYKITEKGRFYVDYLCKVPFPQERRTFVVKRPIEELEEKVS